MAFLMIIFICYIIVALIRQTKVANEWLPLISSVIGVVLSIIAFYTVPSIVPCDTIDTAIFYGFFCGLSATGSNQVLKQAVKYIQNKYGIELHIPTVTSDNKGD